MRYIIFITGLPFPEIISIVKEECGLVNVSWEASVQSVFIKRFTLSFSHTRAVTVSQ